MTASPKLPPDMLSALQLDRFVAFDVETTGLDPKYEQMIEVGAVRFVAGQEADGFNSFIHCPRPLPANIVRMTGIRDEMLTDAPQEKRVVNQLLDFIGADPLAGHHVSFDLSFLTAAAKRSGHSRVLEKRPCADSALIARVLLPTLPSRGLTALGRFFNLDIEEAHRARSDARRSGQVLLCLLSYFHRVDIKTVDVLRRIAEGLNHPSAWIFPAWAQYLIRTSSLEGRLNPYRLPYLTDNVIGKLPHQQTYSSERSDSEDGDSYNTVDETEVGAFFAEKGSLAKTFPHFELRPQQAQMAQNVAQTFNQGGILAVEAGTGIGKSLAYLVPAIRWAQKNRRRAERVIISTNTKNLQEQLCYKDLPQLSQSLAEPFCAVLLKGRDNYLCLSRWENLITEQPLKLSQGERLALLPLVLWAQQTCTGDVAEVGAFGSEGSNALWSRLASDQGSCRGKRCQQGARGSRCFHARARSAAARAHIVVINHALLMADLAANRAPIGAYSTLVVDEAHHLERAAAQHLGKELNAWMFQFWARRVYDAEGPPQGLLARLLLGLGAAQSEHPVIPGLKHALEDAADKVIALRQASGDFFRNLTANVRNQLSVPPAAGHTQNGDYTPKLRLRDPAAFLKIGNPEELPLYQSSLAIAESLRKIIAALDDIPLSVLPRSQEWKDEINGSLEELLQFIATFRFFFLPPDENWVYWAELPRKAEYDALLYAAPLNASDLLRDQLFKPLRSAILTSATLTVAGRFHYFLRKIGLSDARNVQALQLGSPFDYARQMLVGLPAFLPTPGQPQFEMQIAQTMRDILKRIPRGTLGLFTAHRTLRSIGETLQQEIPSRTLLIQGQNGSRNQLLRRFREEPGSILLGTDSFWEGIDVVGEALELLLVAKLPFEVPSEPLVEARLEKLKAEGKDPFMYYTVPEAIIRLRQGIGRLIRSRTDHGAALICDSRLIHSRYGEAFLQSLPVPVKVFKTPEEMIECLSHFFAENNKKDPEGIKPPSPP